MQNPTKRGLYLPQLSRRNFLKVSAAGTAASLFAGLPFEALAQQGLVAFVHTQAAGDSGPVDSMLGKLEQLAKDKGVQTRAVYAQDPATYETVFRTLGDAGAAVIVSTFNDVTDPFKQLAPQYPDTKWVHLFADKYDPPIPNLVSVSYDYYLGCYLSGVFGASMSASGKLGFIGGISLPQLNADFNAYKAGVLSVNPNASVIAAFAGSFQDPAKGHEVATQMFADGIDYIQTDAAATDGGIIAAAKENPGKLVSCLDPAQYALGPKSLISIVGLDFGTSLYNEVAAALDPSWTGGRHSNTGLGTGVIDLLANPLFTEQGDPAQVSKRDAVWPAVGKARSAILDGSLSVPFNTTL
jgi:basic membrane protein A and related proteins